MNGIGTDGMLERRPMQPEERAIWTQRTKTAGKRMQTAACVACGGKATRVLGDLLTGPTYCSRDFDVARQRVERDAMKRQ